MSSYVRRSTVERRLHGERRLVQPLDAATPTQLAGSAPLIWVLLEHHCTAEEITQVLLDRFDSDVEAIRGGVADAISMMLRERLIEEVTP